MLNKIRDIFIGPYLFILFIISAIIHKIKRYKRRMNRKKLLPNHLKKKMDESF